MKPKHFIHLKLWSSGMWLAYTNRNNIWQLVSLQHDDRQCSAHC